MVYYTTKYTKNERVRALRVAIVDDDPKDLGHLRDVLETYAETRNMDMEVSAFSSGSDLMKVFQPGKYELIFFDNYIGNGLGIDFARTVRAQDAEVEFVFVSMSPEFAVAGFEVRAMHYLIKPATLEAIEKVFERFLKHSLKSDAPMIELTFDYHSVMVPVRSIRYLEIIGRGCCVHGEKDFQTNATLKKIMEELPPDEFVRTHSSYAVRLSCIRTMTKTDFVLDNGEVIPIGRAFNECKSTYIEYLTKKQPQ